MLVIWHSVIGGAVVGVALVVGLWALAAARGGAVPSRPLTAGVLLAIGLLLVQILLGIPRWVQAGIPGMSVRGVVHVGGPIVALIVALGLIVGEARTSAGRQAMAMLVIAGVALLSFAVRLLV